MAKSILKNKNLDSQSLEKTDTKPIDINISTKESILCNIDNPSNQKTRINVKSEKRIENWLNSHNFCPEKYRKSDFVKFLTNCPLSNPSKQLSIHNTNITKDALTLMLKDRNITLCFNLLKVKEGFLLKTTNEPAWVFNSKGKLVKRIEHKKVKVWLEKHGISFENDQKNDLQIFISSCPECKNDKPLRFHRSTQNRLDLQCGCINYFRLFDMDGQFVLTHRSKILKTFDRTGAEITKENSI